MRYPIKLAPVTKQIIWGGTRLSREYGIGTPGEKIAEAWELTCRPDGVNNIVGGEYDGKSFEEYKDIALVCGWYGEKKILDDILEYIWNNVQKDKNHPFFRNKDRGVEGWFEKICEDSNDYERLHEICEREIQKHKVEKLPYRNII